MPDSKLIRDAGFSIKVLSRSSLPLPHSAANGRWAAAFCAAAMILPITAAAETAELNLTGTGQVEYQPDSARLSFVARAENSDAAKATELVNRTIQQWRKRTASLRSSLEDYSDASVQLYTQQQPPMKEDQEPQSINIARQTVQFEIRDLKLLNELLETAQALGMNYSLQADDFFHSKEDAFAREALGLAIDDARATCAFTANRVGMTCGPLKSMSLMNGGGRPYPKMEMMRASDSGPVTSSGTREVSVEVSATFILESD